MKVITITLPSSAYIGQRLIINSRTNETTKISGRRSVKPKETAIFECKWMRVKK